jgi:hypothetical protein
MKNITWTEILEDARQTGNWQLALTVMVDTITGQDISDLLDALASGQPLDKKQKWQAAAIVNRFIDERAGK